MNRRALLVLLVLQSVVAACARADGQQFAALGELQLENGEVIDDCRVGYLTFGELNAARSNAVLMPTWFTGKAAEIDAFGHVGPGRLLDTDHYFVIAVDSLANGVSCSPSNSITQAGKAFPAISIGDMVDSQYRLLTEHLGIDRLHAVIGFSMGGIQVFDWIRRYPAFVVNAVAINGTPGITSYDRLQWELHTDLIETARRNDLPDEDLLRIIGSLNLLTLWTPAYVAANVGTDDYDAFVNEQIERYRGFDWDDYIVQLEAILAFDADGDSDADLEAYAEAVSARVLVIGSAGDHMVVAGPAERAAAALGADYVNLDNDCGHLAFICSADRVNTLVAEFLAPWRPVEKVLEPRNTFSTGC